MERWTFLTNHAVVLSLIARHQRITAQDLAVAAGITERSVRRIIADLYINRYISKERKGRGIRYRIHSELPLRHRTHREIAVGAFLRTLGWKKRKRPTQNIGV